MKYEKKSKEELKNEVKNYLKNWNKNWKVCSAPMSMLNFFPSWQKDQPILCTIIF